MSIRVRDSGGMRIALCAAETDAMPDDLYLDDADHEALAVKFADDWQGQTVAWGYPEEWAEMEKHKVRDAVEELNKWLASGMSAFGQDPEEGLEAKPASPTAEGGDAQTQ